MRDADGRFYVAHPLPEHWEAIKDNNAQSRALYKLASHSHKIHTVERADDGKMLVGYTNGAGVRRTAIYGANGQVIMRRNW
jgi:hypothetical protein